MPYGTHTHTCCTVHLTQPEGGFIGNFYKKDTPSLTWTRNCRFLLRFGWEERKTIIHQMESNASSSHLRAARTTFLAVSESEMSLLLNVVTYNYAIISTINWNWDTSAANAYVALYTSATKFMWNLTTKLNSWKELNYDVRDQIYLWFSNSHFLCWLPIRAQNGLYIYAIPKKQQCNILHATNVPVFFSSQKSVNMSAAQNDNKCGNRKSLWRNCACMCGVCPRAHAYRQFTQIHKQKRIETCSYYRPLLLIAAASFPLFLFPNENLSNSRADLSMCVCTHCCQQIIYRNCSKYKWHSR